MFEDLIKECDLCCNRCRYSCSNKEWAKKAIYIYNSIERELENEKK